MKYFVRTFAKELGEEGVEQTSRSPAPLAARYGDDAIKVAQPLGPHAVRCAEEFGPGGFKLLQRHGREGMLVLQRQGSTAAGLVQKYGDEAADVLVRQPGIGPKLPQTYPAETFPAITPKWRRTSRNCRPKPRRPSLRSWRKGETTSLSGSTSVGRRSSRPAS